LTFEFAIEVLFFGGVIPAAITIAVVFAANSLFAENVADRWAMAAGMSIAFIAGYAILPDWAAFWPERHWQWLPYLAAAAMVIGPVGLARGVWTAERWLLWILLAAVSAWFLVPTWQTLDPPRQVYIPLLAAYLVLLTALIDPLARRFSPNVVLAQLALAASAVAILVVAGAKSMVYGQLAGIAAAATAGCFLAAFLSSSRSMTRGMVSVYSVLVGGMAFVGYVEPEKPLAGMLLLPAAPAAMWLGSLGPLARLRGAAAIAVQTLLVVAVLVVGGIAIWTGV
jgi:hypothetical protein